MPIFDINPSYVRSVRKVIKKAEFIGPWEIMPVEPGDPQQQLWVHDVSDATLLKLLLPFNTLTLFRQAVR